MKRKELEEVLLKLGEGESILIKFKGKDAAVRSLIKRINAKNGVKFSCAVTQWYKVYKLTRM